IQHWFANSPLWAQEAIICDPTMDDGTCPNGVVQRVLTNPPGVYAGQKVTGYSSNDCAYTMAMAEDLWQRGFDGVVINFPSGAYTCVQPTMQLSRGLYTGQPDAFTAACSPTSPMARIDQGLQQLQNSMLAVTTKAGVPPQQFQFAIQFGGDFNDAVTCACQNADCSAPNDVYQAQCIRDHPQAQAPYYMTGNSGHPPT